MPRGQLTPEERDLLQAQIAQTRGETSAQQQKLALAAQELALRQQATTGELEASRAKTAKEAELTPFEKLLTLARVSEPNINERMNKMRVAADILGARERAQSAAATNETALKEREMMIGAQREDRKAATKAQIQDALISHLSQRGDVPISMLAETLRQGGNPEMADALSTVHAADVEKKVTALQAQIPLLQKQGTLEKSLPAMQADPDVWTRLAPIVEQTRKTVATAPSTSDYPGYGVASRLKYAPIDLMNFTRAGENMTAIPFMNLLNSMVGAPPVRRRQPLPLDYNAAIETLRQD